MTGQRASQSFIVCLILALLLAACGANAQIEATPTKIPRAVAPIKQTYEVQRGEVTAKIQFTGRVVPVKQNDLSYPIDGRVRNVYYQEGDVVPAGEVIADLTVLDGLEKRKAADDLTVREAELGLENAQLELEVTRLSANEATRDQEIAIKQNDVELAQVHLQSVQLAIQDLQDSIAAAKLVAPFEGQLLTINIAPGSNVAGFRPVATLADVTDLEIGALVQRAKLDELVEGTPVLIEGSNKPDVKLEGTIRRIPYRSSEVDSNDPMVRVSLPVSAQEAGLELEDQVDVTVIVGQKNDVIWLPVQAVRTFQSSQFVVVRDGDIERRADVVTGIEGGNRIEIVSGLEVGQIVVGP